MLKLFENTRFANMSFTREFEWDKLTDLWNRGYQYVSPVFLFENGQRIVIDKQGNIVEI